MSLGNLNTHFVKGMQLYILHDSFINYSTFIYMYSTPGLTELKSAKHPIKPQLGTSSINMLLNRAANVIFSSSDFRGIRASLLKAVCGTMLI